MTARGERRGGASGGEDGAPGEDGDAEDLALRQMRAVWLTMRDEEPPAAGLSALLAAAGSQASELRRRRAWWQRLSGALRRPPALALATFAVVVAGAVVVLQREPLAPRGLPPAPVEDATRTPAGSPHDQASGSAGSTTVAPATSGTAVEDRPSAAASPAFATPPPPAPAPQRAPVAPPARRAASRAEQEPRPAPPSASPRPRSERGAQASRGVPGAGAGYDRAEGGLSAPAEAAKPAPAKPAVDDDEALYGASSAAAARGDCAAVRRLVGKLAGRAQEERDRLANDAAVARCLAP